MKQLTNMEERARGWRLEAAAGRLTVPREGRLTPRAQLGYRCQWLLSVASCNTPTSAVYAVPSGWLPLHALVSARGWRLAVCCISKSRATLNKPSRMESS